MIKLKSIPMITNKLNIVKNIRDKYVFDSLTFLLLFNMLAV